MNDTLQLLTINPSNLGRMAFHLGKLAGLIQAERISAAHLTQLARPHVDAGLLLIARTFNPEADIPMLPIYIPADQLAQWMYRAGFQYGFERYDEIIAELCGHGTCTLDAGFVMQLTMRYDSLNRDEKAYNLALQTYRDELAQDERPALPLEKDEDP